MTSAGITRATTLKLDQAINKGTHARETTEELPVNESCWPDSARYRSLLADLTVVAEKVDSAGKRAIAELDSLPEHQRASGLNLRHYQTLRSEDLRPIQTRLAALALSSLGRAESHVQWSLESLLRNLRRLAGDAIDPDRPDPSIGFADGSQVLAEHSDRLLGPLVDGRAVRIMVTMPSEAATNRQLVYDLLSAGMDCARINCAHDGPAIWEGMIANIRESASQRDRDCRVLMDMAGPKLRTGAVEPGHSVIRVRPRRDDLGRVTSLARVWLAPADIAPLDGAEFHVPVAAAWVASLTPGEEIRFTDSRDRHRTWTVDRVTPRGAWATADRTAYLTTATILHRVPSRSHGGGGSELAVEVSALPPSEGYLLLHVGDRLRVTRDMSPGVNAVRGQAEGDSALARIGCALEEVFDDVRAGERIWFDDGKIAGLVEATTPDDFTVVITEASAQGVKLRGQKGINLPDTDLRVRALGQQDLENIAFAIEHADLIGLSFAQDPADVRDLVSCITAANEKQLGIILKIETKRGFEALPLLLREALAAPAAGVMIARGDLAIECGYERMAEVQEEILWLAEAAHVPVIWATQVLETLAQTGQPSRAEITDAAMGQRAECVMLNKGPHIVEAVRALDDILRRMQGHQLKKQSLLRQLHAWTE